jgi:hypothetical protein
LNGWLKFLGGRTTDFPWTVGSRRSAEGLRRESLSIQKLRRENNLVRSGSTRVVDLVLEFRHFRIRGVEKVVTRRKES